MDNTTQSASVIHVKKKQEAGEDLLQQDGANILSANMSDRIFQVYFIHIPGAINPADILSKHWGYTQVKTMLKAILFWEGDTGDIEEE